MTRQENYIDVVRTSEEPPLLVQVSDVRELRDRDVIVQYDGKKTRESISHFELVRRFPYAYVGILVYQCTGDIEVWIGRTSELSIKDHYFDSPSSWPRDALSDSESAYIEAKEDLEKAESVARRVLGL